MSKMRGAPAKPPAAGRGVDMRVGSTLEVPTAPMPTPRVDESPGVDWANWHNTPSVGGRVARQLTPWNQWQQRPAGMQPAWWVGIPGIQALRRIVRDAEGRGERVRGFGGGWSLNNVAFTDQNLINTTQLSDGLWFVDMQTETRKDWMLAPGAQVDARRLVLAQAGTRISTVHGWLEPHGLSLPTCGASNGQTIIGAISTGTHGSAHSVGAMQDYVAGLHVIGPGGQPYWIERASRPIVSDALCQALGAIPRRDDALFDAAVVGFGCFGLVHAVLLEVAPIYLLERFTYQRDFDDVVRDALPFPLESWSAIAPRLGLPSTDVPFHFEIVLNPYRLGAGEKGAFIRVFYQRAVDPTGPLPRARVPEGQTLNSRELVGLVGVAADIVPGLIGTALQGQLVNAIQPMKAGTREGVLGTCSQQFGDSEHTGRGTSMEIGVPRAQAAKAVELLRGVTRDNPFGAPIALRYVKASRALLAFTSFSDITCTIEMPGLDNHRAEAAHRKIFEAFAASDIPHAYHWGQVLPENIDWVRRAFGPRLDQWLAARAQLLPTAAARRTFANEMVERMGLSGATP